MQFVYIVTKTWTDDDGLGKSDPQLVAVFLDKQKAHQFIFNETGQQTALDYGHANVRFGHSYNRWNIREMEISD